MSTFIYTDPADNNTSEKDDATDEMKETESESDDFEEEEENQEEGEEEKDRERKHGQDKEDKEEEETKEDANKDEFEADKQCPSEHEIKTNNHSMHKENTIHQSSKPAVWFVSLTVATFGTILLVILLQYLGSNIIYEPSNIHCFGASPRFFVVACFVFALLTVVVYCGAEKS